MFILIYIYFRTVNGTSNDGLKSKSGPKRPRRKFPWNEEFRYTYYVIYNQINNILILKLLVGQILNYRPNKINTKNSNQTIKSLI